MAAKPTKTETPKRLNRAVGVAEALNRVLEPAMRKRGFASRDILSNWAAMAPAPYGEVARPDRLVWPRGARGAEGATLYLRCMPGHGLALSHEGPRIAAAVNRYFGYVLVSGVRLATEPFMPHSGGAAKAPATVDAATRQQVDAAVAAVEDAEIREALRRLGEAVASRKGR